LGGIGKMQIAIEYAHRYRNDYNAVFFIRTDTETALTAGLVEIAGVLALPGRDAKDQKETVGAVKRWLLEHDRWLLIVEFGKPGRGRGPLQFNGSIKIPFIASDSEYWYPMFIVLAGTIDSQAGSLTARVCRYPIPALHLQCPSIGQV
jgi:hypothetical protein